jgi:hypothetical protein
MIFWIEQQITNMITQEASCCAMERVRRCYACCGNGFVMLIINIQRSGRGMKREERIYNVDEIMF